MTKEEIIKRIKKLQNSEFLSPAIIQEIKDLKEQLYNNLDAEKYPENSDMVNRLKDLFNLN